MAFWFGYFGLINYQMLQALHYAYAVRRRDADWWRR